MEFAKYYNVTNKLNEMLSREGVLFGYKKDSCKGLYVCMDTHDFWICRIIEGYNSEYEQEEGKWLIERNKIDKYDFIEFTKEKINDDSEVNNRHERESFINRLELSQIIEFLILMDDDNGLENWDNYEADTLNEAIEVIDDGYGIIELAI